MSDIYRLVFGAPRPGNVSKPARWSSIQQTLDARGGAQAFDFVASQPAELEPRRYVEVDISVPRPAGDPNVTGVTGSANVVILVPKWPVPCEAALQVELGRALDKWRLPLGYTPYVAAATSDNSARKLRIRYEASGKLTITGDLPTLEYDLLALSKPGDDQQLNVVVIPETNQKDPKLAGSTAEIRINGGAPIPVTG